VNEPEDTGPNWFRDLEEIAVELESEVDMHGPTHVQLIDLVHVADLYRILAGPALDRAEPTDG
jgi:hypothetical protein